MLDLEENLKLLQELKEKLKDIGESLWHTKPKKRNWRTWKRNNERRLFVWHKKFKYNIN